MKSDAILETNLYLVSIFDNMPNQESTIRIDSEYYNDVLSMLKKVSDGLKNINFLFSEEMLIKQYDIILQKLFLYKYSLNGKIYQKDIKYIKNVVTNNSLLDFYNQYKCFEPKKYLTWDKLTKLSDKGLKIIVDDICKSVKTIEDELIFYLSLYEIKHPEVLVDPLNKSIALTIISYLLAIVDELDESKGKAANAIFMKLYNDIAGKYYMYKTIISGRSEFNA